MTRITGANAVSLSAMSWVVTVVPIFAPNITPSDEVNDMSPASTSPIVITVVAVEDWMSAVKSAPIKVPRRGVEVSE